MTDRINFTYDGEPWVWMRPEICDCCAEKCDWWSYHKMQHKQKNYEMNQVRLYLDHKASRDGQLIPCPFLTEHIVSQDGSQPQIDDRKT